MRLKGMLVFAVLAFSLLLYAPFVYGDGEEEKAKETAKDDTVKVKVSDTFLATWQRVGALTEKAGAADVEKTTTVAGARSAEAEDEAMDNLYFKGGARYPTRKELRDAIAGLKETIKANPKAESVPEMMYFVGQCHSQLGEGDEALDMYKELTKKYSKSAWAEKAKKEIELLNKASKAAKDKK